MKMFKLFFTRYGAVRSTMSHAEHQGIKSVKTQGDKFLSLCKEQRRRVLQSIDYQLTVDYSKWTAAIFILDKNTISFKNTC